MRTIEQLEDVPGGERYKIEAIILKKYGTAINLNASLEEIQAELAQAKS